MVILVDMDNTLADFDSAFLSKWRRLYPTEAYVPLDERRSFHALHDYPEQLQDKVYALYHSEGLIRNLPPVAGGVQAVKDMLAEGHDVRFCTSHLFEYDHCVLEKYQWVEAHFGKEQVDRIILTRDKTMVRGDILIDDKPKIHGSMKPTWEHIIYDRPYNRDITGQRRLTWGDWRGVVFPAGSPA